MKKLIIAAALVVSTAALSQNQVIDLLRPSPWTIGIAIGKWIITDQKKIYYVEVVGEGSDIESARQHAFRMAVERAVGTVVSRETEAVNAQLRRDEIITYAAGYVQDYTVVDQRRVDHNVQVQMKVWVSHSAISNRLLNVSRDNGSVEGSKISEQINSVQRERQSADRLLSTVLADYPRRAFDITLAPTRVVLTDQRRGELQISFVVRWNQQYVASIDEVLQSIKQKSDCGKWYKQCNQAKAIKITGTNPSYFDDTVAYDLMHKEMVISRPQLLVSIQDQFGVTQYKQCYSAPELDYTNYAPWHYVELGGYAAALNLNAVKRFTVAVTLDKLPTRLLDRVDVAVVRSSHC